MSGGFQDVLTACTSYVKVLYCSMIQNFRDRATEDIYNGVDSKAARSIPPLIWNVAARKLDMMNAARSLQDLKVPPGNRLELLKGNWKGWHSIRVNEQFRIVFRWIDGNAKDVSIVDYH
jgi:toxin HigB-1